jgi:hypothetical protein
MGEAYNESYDSKTLFWKTQYIYRHDGRLYIKRLIIFRLPFLALMLHRIYLSDTDCMHNHPWPFVTCILWRGYWEYTPNKTTPTHYKAPAILYRPSSYTHRLEVKEDGRPTISLVFTGKKIRKWGFFTPTGWVYWRQYKNTGTCE